MKKFLCVLAAVILLLTTGCQNASDRLVVESEKDEVTEIQTDKPKTEEPEKKEPDEEGKTKIALSQELKLTNDWTILGDYDFEITRKGKKDRVILATSAGVKNGEMMWDDTQYWTVAVIAGSGAYNLYSQDIPGRVYMEVNECFVRGVVTPVITVYIFSGNDREIRNYIFDGTDFVESQEYNTKNFSTGGINNMYSTIREYKPM